MSATDPLAIVWDALERGGCEPHGRPWDFRARCPVHNGDSRDSLHVSVGTDGRGVLYCFAHQCECRDILAAIGLMMADLFPAGHRHARRIAFPVTRRSDLDGTARELANVASASQELGTHYVARLDFDTCLYCGAQPVQLVIGSRGDHTLFCANYCTVDEFIGALAGRVEDERRER